MKKTPSKLKKWRNEISLAPTYFDENVTDVLFCQRRTERKKETKPKTGIKENLWVFVESILRLLLHIIISTIYRNTQ